ncbi:hypothetical protein PG994_003818 [Apiospora phragmitis]|uniref:Uncharacterized protein n=1 Tax=Apiospora phragmitis TaxID=2905665 RepID=A0ABR1VZ66_9PEZI
MAEGLLMYLAPARVRSLVRELVEYFGGEGGEILLDTVSSLYVKYTDHDELLKASGAKWKWGADDAHEVETSHPRLRLLEHVCSVDYMGKKAFGQSQVPLFGEDAAGVLKMAMASMSSINNAFGQNARFEFARSEDKRRSNGTCDHAISYQHGAWILFPHQVTEEQTALKSIGTIHTIK